MLPIIYKHFDSIFGQNNYNSLIQVSKEDIYGTL